MSDDRNFSWKSDFNRIFMYGGTKGVLESSMEAGSNTSIPMEVPSDKYNWGILFLSPIVVFGITGNILVCMAVSMEKRLQTVTNYFLLSLAITDLLVCFIVMPISMVNDFFGYWPFNSVMCNLFITGDVLMSTSSILHLCSISLQRYLAIRNPLKSRNKSKSIVLLKITFIWVAAATITSPITALGIIDQKNILNERHCILKNNDFIIYGSVLAFFIPLVIMVLSYSLTVRLLYKQSKLCDPNGPGPDSGQPIIRRSKSRRQKNPNQQNKRRSRSDLSIGQGSFEMEGRSRSNTVSHCDDNFLQIPNVISHTSSCDSIYSTNSIRSPSRTRAPQNNGFLNVPNNSQQGSSTESLLSENDISTDDDTNHLKPFNLMQDNESIGKRSLRDVMAKQIIVKASSILNLARERNSDKMAVRTEQKASKVLGFVFVIFVVFWSPFFAVNVLSVLCKNCSFNPVLISIFVWLGWISSTINPIIYTMFNSTFKQTFIKLLRCQYGFLQKSYTRRYWNKTTGFTQKDSSESNVEIPL